MTEFNPQTVQDIFGELSGEHSADFRMVASYWDMAAAFVNHGAIDEQMFNVANPGGVWFERGNLKIHLAVEKDFRPATKSASRAVCRRFE